MLVAIVKHVFIIFGLFVSDVAEAEETDVRSASNKTLYIGGYY